jgi:hypothetical protein
MCFTLRLHTSAAPPRVGLTQALGLMDTNSLISQYRRTVVGVETESCNCCAEPLAGDEWRERGCGISYEYLNDIEVRSDLEQLMQSGDLTLDQLASVHDLDNRLKVLLAANNVSHEGSRFWKNGLPAGVAE